MATIRRLTDSAVLVTTDHHVTLFDPGFHTFTSGELDLTEIGDVTRVLITHEHGDHASPDFINWLIGRRSDLVVYSNPRVAEVLESAGVQVSTEVPADVTVEDVLHERIASGATPPNRAFTIDGLFTHPGDSRQPTTTAPVLALPLIAPWDSATGAVEFARRLRPRQVIPVHDFYLSKAGRDWVANMVKGVLAGHGIELVPLDWGEGYTV
ncbi:MAG: MBL fold metallo-hydrolase [Actinobacteria bacterium]|nr:MBL fold metallo-hydrolase [Actinomycetota bacterium]